MSVNLMILFDFLKIQFIDIENDWQNKFLLLNENRKSKQLSSFWR